TVEIGYENEASEESARDVINQMVRLWSLAHNIKVSIDMNLKWTMRADGGKNLSLGLNDGVKMQDFVRVNQTSLFVKACLVKPDLFDSSAFKNNLPLLRKSLTDKSLQKALIYFHEEVLDNERPLYGIYKAIEELCFAVGGREKLARLVGQGVRYVDDLMQTTQIMRHARTQAKRVLVDEECRQRAKILIEAYAGAI
ncbi:MAG: hypothetical protein UT66_C0045G0006, partial [candidate division CPR2 bacterium GW2011_GWC1_39_9]